MFRLGADSQPCLTIANRQTPLATVMRSAEGGLTGYAFSYNRRVGGGLIGSAGGWSMVNAMRRTQDHMKSYERIFNDTVLSDIVSANAFFGVIFNSR